MDQKVANWQAYFQKTEQRPYRPLLETAVAADDSGCKVAIDCGCGTGNDTGYLLDQGYEVHAFDQQADAIQICQRRFGGNPQLQLSEASFEQFQYPSAGMIAANSSLFFCAEDLFEHCWNEIRSALVSQGIFCGDFLGTDDSWEPMPGRPLTRLHQTEVEALFDGFEILRCYERNEPGKTAIGNIKHWHTFTVLARKL